MPRPKTGGRAAGTPNKIKRQTVEMFVDAVFSRLKSEKGTDAEQMGVALLTCGNPAVTAKIWQLLLEWKYGKPSQTVINQGDAVAGYEFNIPSPERETSQQVQ